MAPKKPTASKTSYNIPAVIAKPSAPAPATKSSGAAPKGGGQAASGTKLIQPTKTVVQNKPQVIKNAFNTTGPFNPQGGVGTTPYGPSSTPVVPIKPPDEDDGSDSGSDSGGDGGASLAYQKMQDEKARRNAFALLKDVFTQYGLGELAATLETLMKEGYEPEEATLALKTDVRYNAPYIKRFRGNELRRSAGLNVLSEAEYLALEDDYTKTLKSYGLENYFGVDRSLKQTAMADVIGADISALEFTDRVSTAVDRVKMADPGTKSAFQQFYGIGEADLVQYFLDPKKALVNLKERATAAEIGGAAIGQGLAATMTSAEDLARFGINRQQAQVGYAQIGEDLPTAGSLGRIYSESGVTYNQADAESATFKGLASAKRKKEQLKQLEEGQFSGSSGTALGQGALSTQYLRRGSSAGQF
jgi:hypothetical protein